MGDAGARCRVASRFASLCGVTPRSRSQPLLQRGRHVIEFGHEIRQELPLVPEQLPQLCTVLSRQRHLDQWDSPLLLNRAGMTPHFIDGILNTGPPTMKRVVLVGVGLPQESTLLSSESGENGPWRTELHDGRIAHSQPVSAKRPNGNRAVSLPIRGFAIFASSEERRNQRVGCPVNEPRWDVVVPGHCENGALEPIFPPTVASRTHTIKGVVHDALQPRRRFKCVSRLLCNLPKSVDEVELGKDVALKIPRSQGQVRSRRLLRKVGVPNGIAKLEWPTPTLVKLEHSRIGEGLNLRSNGHGEIKGRLTPCACHRWLINALPTEQPIRV